MQLFVLHRCLFLLILKPKTLHMRKLMAILAGVVLLTTQLYAQTRTVSGKVTDEKGIPLVGVTVSTSSSEKRTLTDNSGNFSIQVSPRDKSLRLTYIGYNAES